MKTPPLIFLFALSAGLAFAQDGPAPQPRTRLDPIVRAAVASTAEETKSEPAAPAPAVVMDRFVVKGIAAIPFVQQKDPVLHGKFTPLQGGSFVERNYGKKSLFIGIKPWFDMMEDDAVFNKRAPKPRINFTLLQLGF